MERPLVTRSGNAAYPSARPVVLRAATIRGHAESSAARERLGLLRQASLRQAIEDARQSTPMQDS